MEREMLLQGMDTRYALFGTFFAFHNRLQATGDAFYQEITCKQFFLIICLELFGENAPTIRELAEVMGSSHQNVKQIADKLERSGFIRQTEYAPFSASAWPGSPRRPPRCCARRTVRRSPG